MIATEEFHKILGDLSSAGAEKIVAELEARLNLPTNQWTFL